MKNLIPAERIEKKIYLIRKCRVMLDRDLAKIFKVGTKALNQSVKRNIERFPERYMFQLTRREFENLKSQIVTSSWRIVKVFPYDFTEHGRG